MLDVNPETGHIKVNFDGIDEMEETCSLDVADRGDLLSRDEVGRLLGKCGESTRQSEASGREGLILYLDTAR